MSGNQYDIVTDRKAQITLVILVFAVTLIDGLDSSIVTLTLPNMANDMGCSVANSSWIMNAYIIGIAAPLLAFTKIADMGRIKEMFTVGTLIFGISSLLCGIAPSFGELIISRFIQGIGASIMGSTAPIIVIRMLPPDMKGRGMSVLAIASGVSLILGPPLGGIITAALSWHWIFYVNIPICLVIVIIGMIRLPKAKQRTKGFPLDMPSVAYLGIAITSALVFLENIVECTVPVWAMYASGIAAAAMSAAFYFRTKRPDISNRLVKLDMFRNREFILVTISFLFTTVIAAGTQYLLTYFLQGSWGMTEIQSSAYFMVVSVFTVAASVAAGRWCDSKGCRTPTAVAVLGRGAFSLMFVFMVPSWGAIPLIIAMAIMGISFGLSGTSQSTRIIHHSKTEYQGEASAIILLANYIGSALGSVAYALMFSTSVKIYGTDADIITNGFHFSCILGVVLAALALICTLAVRNIIPEKTRNESQ